MTAQLAQSLLDQIEALKALLLKREQRINLLEEQVRLLKHQRFGKSSEQSDRQAELFNEAEAGDTAEDDAEADTADAPTETITYQRTTRPRRKPLPADLPRVRIEHDLPEAEEVCACGCQLSPIGEATSEQLDIIPATIRVLVHARRKYACKRCESGVKTAPLPKQPLPKSNASAGLLA